jgi:peptidylamidoglycolate lyase
MRVDRDGHLWLTDVGTHRVLKATVDGRVLLTLGTPGVSGTDGRTFDQPTDVAFGPAGEVFVADGYGNSRIVKFDAAGRYVAAWGRKGTAPGEFDTPHALLVGSDGLLYVSDRGNHRIQVLDLDGRFVRSWDHLGATQCLTRGADDELWVVTYRSVSEILSYDSLAGRLMRLDASSGAVTGSIELPGHWVHAAPDGDLFLANLAGTVIRATPGWRTP